MFTNFLKKVADRDYLLFSQSFFDFISEGERNCKIKITSYDLKGNIKNEVDMNNLTNDFNFLLYGSYMISWLAQILEYAHDVNRNDPAFKRWSSVLYPLFTVEFARNSSGNLFENVKKYNLSDVLSLLDQKTKNTVIEKHSTVQFKIHKVYKQLLVRVVNIPIAQETECQIYLFVILFDFFCKKYNNAHKILGTGCDVLMNHSFNRPFPLIANKIIEVMMETALTNSGNISVMESTQLGSKVWDKFMKDKNI